MIIFCNTHIVTIIDTMLLFGDARAINYVLINGDYILINDDVIAHNVIALFSQIEQDCRPKQIQRTAGVRR